MNTLFKQYRICLAKIVHINALADIEVAADALYPLGYIPDELHKQTLPKASLEKALAENLLFYAFKTLDDFEASYASQALNKHEELIGFASCQRVANYLHLEQVSVKPEHTQKGIGSELVRQVVSKGRALGVESVCLTTFSDLAWNAPFYEKFGFRHLKENEQPPWLRDILWEEQFLGLKKRIAMCAYV